MRIERWDDIYIWGRIVLISIRRSVSSWILSALAQNRKLRIRVNTNFRALGITARSLARTHARTLDTTDSSRDRYTYIIVNVIAWQIPSCHSTSACAHACAQASKHPKIRVNIYLRLFVLSESAQKVSCLNSDCYYQRDSFPIYISSHLSILILNSLI